ncbi:caskin-1-like [Corticium candelabrum]|uniref:caskin-1-like n=1 Tax=Corticium candelabrum TaxID=121492 RepID=UPI002E25CF20|nr:caskin-1-like [Corticium candelabrum]
MSKRSKEIELLKAARDGDVEKLERIFAPQQKKKGSAADPTTYDLPTLQNMKMKVRVNHIDVECTDRNGSTPLITAALNGHKEAVVLLLIYSADIAARDYQNNSALHMAAWQNKSDVVEILLKNGAQANEMNSSGNTPLHFAAQFYQEGKIFTAHKLLQAGAKVMVVNKDGDTPLDLAARFDKKECVSLFVDSDPAAIQSTKSIVEASKNGRLDIVQLLIDCEIAVNGESTGTQALHEACRFFRRDVAELLLSYGANPNLENGTKETARTIIEDYMKTKGMEDKAGPFLDLFDEYKDKEPLVPRKEQERRREQALKTPREQPVAMKEYPLLKNRKRWTQDHPDYRSDCTGGRPNTCLLDDDPTEFWIVPSNAYCWVAFDFGTKFTLTGLQLIGWASDQMVKHFQIETGITLTGPWTMIQSYQANRIGSEDPMEPGVPQDFKDFYATSQYWRILIQDNYGGSWTCLKGVRFYGLDTGVLRWFQELGLIQYYEDFVMRGYNQVSELVRVTSKDLEEIASLPGHRKKIALAVKKMREHVYPLRELKWLQPPIHSCLEHEEIPPFSVQSDPMTSEDLKLVIHGGAEMSGQFSTSLEPDGDNPSTATFKGVKIWPAGRYLIEVQCVQHPDKFIRAAEPIVVAFPTKSNMELDDMFSEMDDMLKF